MIKLEHIILPSPEQMKFIIEGMRNPHNSWDRSDSKIYSQCSEKCNVCEDNHTNRCVNNFIMGDNDHKLMMILAKAGTDHRKFMRMIPIYVRVTAPLYWWKEFDTYKVGTVANSTSTMHKIHQNDFTLDDFSHEHLDMFSLEALNKTISELNNCRYAYINGIEDVKPKEKHYWWQMIQLLPSSYNQTRNVMLNYEVLANIYKSRKTHKLDEWIRFCHWVETLPYSELITGEFEENE